MKKEFQKIIYDLFTASICEYISNLDDINEGFEFNPNNPRVLIQLLYSIQYEEDMEFKAHITINSYRLILSSASVVHKQIISSQVILLPSGEVDYGFYKTILENLSNF